MPSLDKNGSLADAVGKLVLDGSSTEYSVINNNGSLQIQHLGAGGDGTQRILGRTEMVFTDGIGVFDTTGTAEDVDRLYSAALGRSPDVAGLEYWTSQVDDSSVPLSAVASMMMTSPEFINDYGSLSDSAFVDQLYQNVSGRNPYPFEAKFALDFLSFGSGRDLFLLSFSEGPENRAKTLPTAGEKNNAEAYRLYQALGRAPDTDSLSSWAQAEAIGASPIRVAQDFIRTPEFQQDYGAMSGSAFVSTLYQNVLHRAADAAGLQYWTNDLNAGASQASVLLSFTNGLENRVRTAGATHADWVFIPS